MGWIGSPKKIVRAPRAVSVTMTLFGNGVSADGIKARSRWAHPALGWVLNPMAESSWQEERRYDLQGRHHATWRQRQRRSRGPNARSWRKQGRVMELFTKMGKSYSIKLYLDFLKCLKNRVRICIDISPEPHLTPPRMATTRNKTK